jgi:hypothetical protein
MPLQKDMSPYLEQPVRSLEEALAKTKTPRLVFLPMGHAVGNEENVARPRKVPGLRDER